jgi:hypothetical protein
MRAFNHALPDENAASRGCDGAVENSNKSIAGGFDQPSVVLQNTGSYEFALDSHRSPQAVRPERCCLARSLSE